LNNFTISTAKLFNSKWQKIVCIQLITMAVPGRLTSKWFLCFRWRRLFYSLCSRCPPTSSVSDLSLRLVARRCVVAQTL